MDTVLLLCVCLLFVYCAIMAMAVNYAVTVSVVISCRHPERFPAEVMSDAVTWCKAANTVVWNETSNLWTPQKFNFATVLFHTWPATVNDFHKMVSAVWSRKFFV